MTHILFQGFSGRPGFVNNPGFDLVEIDGEDNMIRWVEVKAMTGTLNSRPVGLSKRQFKFAQQEKSIIF